ncbi:trypsin inhibitor ClTI-1 [Chelonia mydas]|uniref:trypsin inhibitor ClTI-1 n=1 Tax=Chelonia mydas TaxID=8469 RepID=UPI000FFB7685|nr:trypsin inhibitor ClTI-1 [Chelonia mydas]XP_043402870.1 trypsin inhibitor ClTI-1 [Chelonia mydas]
MNFKVHIAVLLFCFSAFAEEGTGRYEGLNRTGQLPSYPVCVHYILKPMCILYYRPVCGSDGRTYRNKCELCSYCREHDMNIKIVKEGAC